MNVVRKVTVAKAAGGDLEFVLSDDTKDRYGDVIDAKGWVLDNFKRNPIALFNHDSDFPIGTWTNVRVEGKRLIGKLKLAAEGTSARIDEILSLVEQGILRAVSVGFKVLEREALKDNSGILYKKQELLETSLVSVPANPSAVQLARSLHVSDETINLVFGKNASAHGTVTRGSTAGQGVTSPVRKNTLPMTRTLAERITDAEERLVALKDQLTERVTKAAAEPGEMADEDLAAQDELNLRIERVQKEIDGLKRTEASLASASEVVERGHGGVAVANPRPFAVPAQKVAPADHVIRSLVAKVHSHAVRGEKSAQQILVERYGSDGKIDDATRVVFDVVNRTATAPATTTTSGWASQLVETAFNGFMELLMPASVYPGLAARGMRINFGRAGVISVPTRSATPTIAGSFVAEGSPIPVRQGAFTSQTFTPKKMAVITSFTREIAEHSNPAIEGLLRNAIQEDTSVALDSVLLDATAASTTRPAGLRNGVTVTTATAGGGFAALVGDLKALVGALIAASNGNLRAPVWIMNPVNALSIAVTQNAGGDFPFAQEINGGTFQGYPVIQSSTVTAGMVLLLDAADFVAIEGGPPRFDVSDQATLVYDDTAPAQIGTTGAPNVVGAPARSMWQTDSLALRMIMDVNFGMRRTGVVAWTQSVTW